MHRKLIIAIVLLIIVGVLGLVWILKIYLPEPDIKLNPLAPTAVVEDWKVPVSGTARGIQTFTFEVTLNGKLIKTSKMYTLTSKSFTEEVELFDTFPKTPYDSGKYTIKAKSGEIESNPIDVTVQIPKPHLFGSFDAETRNLRVRIVSPAPSRAEMNGKTFSPSPQTGEWTTTLLPETQKVTISVVNWAGKRNQETFQTTRDTVTLQIDPIKPIARNAESVQVTGIVTTTRSPDAQVFLYLKKSETAKEKISIVNGRFLTSIEIPLTSERVDVELKATDDLGNSYCKASTTIVRQAEPKEREEDKSPTPVSSPQVLRPIAVKPRATDGVDKRPSTTPKPSGREGSGKTGPQSRRETTPGGEGSVRQPEASLIPIPASTDSQTTAPAESSAGGTSQIPVDTSHQRPETVEPDVVQPPLRVAPIEPVQVQITFPDNEQILSETDVTLKGVIRGGKGTRTVTLNSSITGNFNQESGEFEFPTVVLKEGENTLSVTATAQAGGSSTATLTVTRDTNPPTFNPGGSGSLQRYLSEGDFKVYVDDAVSGIREITLIGKEESAIGTETGWYPIPLVKLKEKDGNFTGELSADDKAGNKATLPIRVISDICPTLLWREVYIQLYLKEYDEAEVSLNQIAKKTFAPPAEVNLFQGIIRYHQGAQAGNQWRVALPKYDEAIDLLLDVEAHGRDAFAPGSNLFHEMRYYLGMSYYNKWITTNLRGVNDSSLKAEAKKWLKEFVSHVPQGAGRSILNNKEKADALLKKLSEER